jgi:rhodanese-related sulfurtransferase
MCESNNLGKGGVIMRRDSIKISRRVYVSIVFLVSLLVLIHSPAYAQHEKAQAAKQPPAIGTEISTDELKKVITSKTAPVVDVRSPREYSIAHIPGSINIYETEIDRMAKLLPARNSELVIYCNGPYCHKVKRVAEQLFKMGYTNVKRYQSGIPVWRAYGNTVQTDLEGFKYIFTGDKTAVFVDARSKDIFMKGTVPGAVNIRAGEDEAANTDGRLPYTDKGTRIIVFADNPAEARIVAEEIAHKAYWNSSYFGGSYPELKQAGLW